MFFMTTKQVPISTMKKGSCIVIDGVACRITDTQVSRPGKHGHAKYRVTAVGLLDDKKRDVVMPGHDHVETPIIEKRTASVLSIAGDVANVMDIENYETFEMKIPEELKADVGEGKNILYWIILGERVMKQIKTE
nr:hypothetical protein [uncultured archaeon]